MLDGVVRDIRSRGGIWVAAGVDKQQPATIYGDKQRTIRSTVEIKRMGTHEIVRIGTIKGKPTGALDVSYKSVRAGKVIGTSAVALPRSGWRLYGWRTSSCPLGYTKRETTTSKAMSKVHLVVGCGFPEGKSPDTTRALITK